MKSIVKRLSILALLMLSATVSAQSYKELKFINDQLHDKLDDTAPSSSMVAEWFQRLMDLYDVVSQNDEYVRKLREEHEKTGSLRSGEGTEQEILEKIRKHEERQKLMKMIKSKEYSDDPTINKRLYEVYLEMFKETAISDDNKDLVPHHTFEAPMPNNYNAVGKRRILAETDHSRTVIKKLVEPYPKECYNNGKLVNQTQRYYECKKLDGGPNEQYFRVNQDTHDYLRNYSYSYDCNSSSKQTQVCVCPQGYYDFQCATQTQTKCFVKITSPAFFKGCKGEDSPAYMYSIPGFDPCFPLNFTEPQEIRYELICQGYDETGHVEINKENVGYKYRDVEREPQYDEFRYVATNPETKYSIINPETMKIQFSFQDWKWLSQTTNFVQEINDPLLLTGQKEGNITIDFKKLEDSDARGDSYYVVGGRAYFEADVLGLHVTSFTSKGFFDKLGYVEPAPEDNKDLKIILGVTIPVASIIIITLITLFCCWRKNGKKSHTD